MATTGTYDDPLTHDRTAYSTDSENGRAPGGRKVALPTMPTSSLPNLPSSEGLRQPAGGLLKGATDDAGQLKSAALLVGIKLDLEAEVHLTTRIRGDIVIGLY